MKLLIEFTNRTLDNWERLRAISLDRIFLSTSPGRHGKMLELLRKGDEPALIAEVSQHNRGARDLYHKLLELAGMESGRY